MLGDRRTLGGILLLMVVLSAGAWVSLERLARPWVVLGPSMEPSLHEGDRVIVDLWSYGHRAPRPGEIVVFRGPPPSEAPLVKRVHPSLPFPEDRPDPTRWPGSPPGAGLYVLGDSRQRSVDSRHFGPVPAGRIIGRVAWRYWPPSRFGPTAGGSGFKLPVR